MKGAMAQLTPTDIKESACNFVDSILKGENSPQPPNNPFLLEVSQEIVYRCFYTCQVGVQWCDESLNPEVESPSKKEIYCDEAASGYADCLKEKADLEAFYEAQDQAAEQAYQVSCFTPTAEDCAQMGEKAKQCTKEIIEYFSSEECN